MVPFCLELLSSTVRSPCWIMNILLMAVFAEYIRSVWPFRSSCFLPLTSSVSRMPMLLFSSPVSMSQPSLILSGGFCVLSAAFSWS